MTNWQRLQFLINHVSGRAKIAEGCGESRMTLDNDIALEIADRLIDLRRLPSEKNGCQPTEDWTAQSIAAGIRHVATWVDEGASPDCVAEELHRIAELLVSPDEAPDGLLLLCCCIEGGGGLVCTLPKGHGGQHEAWGTGHNLFKSWRGVPDETDGNQAGHEPSGSTLTPPMARGSLPNSLAASETDAAPQCSCKVFRNTHLDPRCPVHAADYTKAVAEYRALEETSESTEHTKGG